MEVTSFRVLQKGNNNMKHLAYTALVRPILEYGVVCWDHTERCVGTIQSGVLGPYTEDQVSALHRVQRERLNLQII